jgi:deazaflavin-dependent oxidoreductase (nitroreductase family)
MPDGRRFVVFASNNGQDRPPAWWLNLRSDPAGEVRTGRRVSRVRARAAEGAEREALWPRMIALNSRWGEYPKRTNREIPVVLLEPL